VVVLKSRTDNLYAKFVQNMVPFAQLQGLSVETLIDRLEYRCQFDYGSDPEFFPAKCICGETLTAHAYQFDDPYSNAYSTYTIGSICAGNLEREVRRLNCVTKLGKYLCRSKARQFEPLLTQCFLDEINRCDLFTAKVIPRFIWDQIETLFDQLRHPFQKDTAFAEGICVAYKKVPEKAILTYFLPDGTLW